MLDDPHHIYVIVFDNIYKKILLLSLHISPVDYFVNTENLLKIVH